MEEQEAHLGARSGRGVEPVSRVSPSEAAGQLVPETFSLGQFRFIPVGTQTIEVGASCKLGPSFAWECPRDCVIMWKVQS